MAPATTWSGSRPSSRTAPRSASSVLSPAWSTPSSCGTAASTGTPSSMPADEHQLRAVPAAFHPHPRQAGAATPDRTACLGGLCRMDAAVRSFLTYLQVERGASPHTLRNYEGDLRQFLAFLRTAHK